MNQRKSFRHGLYTGVLAVVGSLVGASCYDHAMRRPEPVSVAYLEHSIIAPAVSESECDDLWNRETDGWWECFVSLETERCLREGWCGEYQGTVQIL